MIYHKRRILFIFALLIIPLYSFIPNNLADYIQKGDEDYSKFENLSALDNYLEAYRLSPDS